MNSLKDSYVKLLADHILVDVDDLTPTEVKLIDESFTLFKDKLNDIKDLNDEIKRLSLEVANLKAMSDNTDYNYDEDDN